MGRKRRAAIYVRVSTDRQTTMNQQLELEAVVKRHDWKVIDDGTDVPPPFAESRRAARALNSRWMYRAQRSTGSITCISASIILNPFFTMTLLPR